MATLTENLLTSAKINSFAPISQTTFQDSDLIVIANEELLSKMVSDIMSVREDFFLSSKTTSIVGGVAFYGVPKGAIGNVLKMVTFQDAGGSQRILNRIDIEESKKYSGSTGEPSEYYLSGDEIVLCPTPSTSSGSIVFSYFRKPSKLIETSSCAKITAVSSAGGTTTFTVDTDLSASLSAGSEVDILSGSNPYLLWADEVAITAITTTTIAVATTGVVNAASVVEPQVGDYICPTSYANIPMIPDEFHPVLSQMVAVRMIASLGDIEKWNLAKAILQENRKDALKLIKNRVETTPIRVRGNGFVRTFAVE